MLILQLTEVKSSKTHSRPKDCKKLLSQSQTSSCRRKNSVIKIKSGNSRGDVLKNARMNVTRKK